jgi:AraC family transcriptional regulator
LFIEQALDLLCMHVLRRHSSLDRPPVPPRQGMAPWQVKRVTSFMRDNLERAIGLDELAALISLSRAHFCTSFRKATGSTPHDWLTARRMDRAQELLRDRARDITDIALSVGYQTPSSFSAAFRRRSGMTPTRFRQSIEMDEGAL